MKVEVAVLEETTSRDVEARSATVSMVVVAKVVVALRTYKLSIVEEAEAARLAVVTVPVAVIFATLVRSPEIIVLPCTAKVAEGEVVATPTLPPSVAR